MYTILKSNLLKVVNYNCRLPLPINGHTGKNVFMVFMPKKAEKLYNKHAMVDVNTVLIKCALG